MSLRVLIAGGGIGGLCLAQGLRKAGIDCSVYESAPGIVQTGYRLHMNASGGAALRQCLPDNLFELYMQTSRVNVRREMFVMLDDQGRELGARPHIGPPNDPVRPHTAVNRRTLRQILAAGLDDTVRFGHAVTGFDLGADEVRLLFADGSSTSGDVLVAADGINSVIRRQLLPDVPTIDTGARTLSARAPLTDALVAMLPEALFDGFASASSADGSRFVFGVYQPRRRIADAAADLAPGATVDPVDPYMMVNFAVRQDSPLLADVPNLWTASPDRLHAIMRTAVRGWHPGLVELVDRIDLATLFPLSVRRLEPARPWTPSRVTLLGDAIHAMPPTFGAGANSALRDAASLATTMERVSQGIDLIEAIGDYERDMRTHVFPILRASADPRAMRTDFRPEELYAAT
jgi:salicylate hydroxylase